MPDHPFDPNYVTGRINNVEHKLSMKAYHEKGVPCICGQVHNGAGGGGSGLPENLVTHEGASVVHEGNYVIHA